MYTDHASAPKNSTNRRVKVVLPIEDGRSGGPPESDDTESDYEEEADGNA